MFNAANLALQQQNAAHAQAVAMQRAMYQQMLPPKPDPIDPIDLIAKACPSAFWLRPDWTGNDNLRDPGSDPFWMRPPVPFKRERDVIDARHSNSEDYLQQMGNLLGIGSSYYGLAAGQWQRVHRLT